MEYRPMPQYTYPSLTDYGLVGDGRSAALVSSEGGVDWWCPARFDASSAFARILDKDRGGHFTIGLPVRHRRVFAYVPRTNVLTSTYVTSDVDVVLTTFMPFVQEDGAPPHPRLVRILHCTRGPAIDVTVDFAPAFDYARRAPGFDVDGGIVRADGGDAHLTLTTTLDGFDATGSNPRTTVRLGEGDVHAFILDYADEAPPEPVEDPLREALAAKERTTRFWHEWAKRCTYEGPYQEAVVRSLLALKLMQYAEEGTFVAAPTCSLPETLGGERNWDYRYAWLRDGVFIVEALQKAGYEDESLRFREWLAAVARRDAPDKLQMLYRVDKGRDLPESTLDHLEGYRASGPVRVGNGAAEQHQLDTFGELMMCFPLAEALFAGDERDENWDAVKRLVNWVSDHWKEPDSGIWELRGRRRQYVYSKAMAWAAFDHALRVAERQGFEDAPVDAWSREQDRVREHVLARGFKEEFTSFTQAEDRPDADASNLLLPLIGIVSTHDARMRATTTRVERDLVSHGLVHRYVVDDNLPGNEGAFLVGSFWLAMVLAEQGDLPSAKRYFERALATGGPLGLLAEEADPVSGVPLGNYPQGLSHLGLVLAAFKIAEAERKSLPG